MSLLLGCRARCRAVHRPAVRAPGNTKFRTDAPRVHGGLTACPGPLEPCPVAAHALGLAGLNALGGRRTVLRDKRSVPPHAFGLAGPKAFGGRRTVLRTVLGPTSALDAGVEGDDAGAEVVHVHVAKAGGLHHGLEGGLVGVHSDGLGQVAVALGIAREQRTELGQDVEGVPVVGLAQRLGDARELQHQQPAARLEHPAHLGQGQLLVGHVAQAEGDADKVEALALERQLLGVGQAGRQDQTFIEQAVAPLAQHGLVDVGVHDQAALAHLAGEGARQVAGAASDVERALARLEVGHLHRVGLPGPVQAGRHQVIHQVVFGRDRVEHAAHPAGLLALVDLLEAEMGLGHREISGSGRSRRT
mmetsp:Transcript_50958/g.119475  ORF Transcript_50958/g.119475 Transcript_50958/m.119475 type:complete len:360 (-) Transcript_50958:1906-2985(-)